MRPRTLLIALVVSLALNLFLAGLIVGAVLNRQHGLDHRAAVAGQSARAPLWRAGDALPQEKRRAFRSTLREAALSQQDAVRQSRQLRRQAAAMLEQPTFDAAAAADLMRQARLLDAQTRSVVEGRLMAFAATLSPAERASLAAGLREVMPGQFRDPKPDKAAKLAPWRG